MNTPKIPKRIAIVGPESTGKSTLSKYLAKYYHTQWVPEYARYYCANLTEPCTWQDEINMFHGQMAMEDAYMDTCEQPFLFCDTTILTVKIWSDKMFGTSPQVVLDALPHRNYDLYLLLDIDMPWEDDPLREFPNEREYFLNIWKQELDTLGAKYHLISGLGDTRTQNAINVVNKFLISSSIL